jgi:hypothetical protein
MKAVWVVIVVVCSSQIASAQPAADPAMSDAEHGTMDSDPRESPGFVAIDRLDASSRAGIDLTYLGPHDDIFTDSVLWLGSTCQVMAAVARRGVAELGSFVMFMDHKMSLAAASR